ncbi:hypothetical protein E2C01_040036 [Portunus trituberculatus]|uniref:Uncharacterized protein n=1 Tax=Portunus trituberculatus TaxID=210409 RepID=A0A5B7FM85_PORTR|nr:hypothetical protein [Portunus trituberculatus]
MAVLLSDCDWLCGYMLLGQRRRMNEDPVAERGKGEQGRAGHPWVVVAMKHQVSRQCELSGPY